MAAAAYNQKRTIVRFSDPDVVTDDENVAQGLAA